MLRFIGTFIIAGFIRNEYARCVAYTLAYSIHYLFAHVEAIAMEMNNVTTETGNAYNAS